MVYLVRLQDAEAVILFQDTVHFLLILSDKSTALENFGSFNWLEIPNTISEDNIKRPI